MARRCASLPIRQKVHAYITRGTDLLVFRHTAFPAAGIQVPGGTVEPGEALDAAVLREAWEETGLEGLAIRAHLGMRRLDMTSYGRAEIFERHFYHLEFAGVGPDRWLHLERNATGATAPIEFELYWVRFPEDVPRLRGRLGALLHKLDLSPPRA